MRKPPPGPGPGRPKGMPNKHTTLLREAIVLGAEAVGDAGRDGLIGYCRYLAREEPRAFAALLGKVLPLQLTGDAGGPIVVEIVRFGTSGHVDHDR